MLMFWIETVQCENSEAIQVSNIFSIKFSQDMCWHTDKIGSLRYNVMTATATGTSKKKEVSKTTTLHTRYTFWYILCHHCMTTTWNSLIWHIVQDKNIKGDFFFLFLNLNEALTNSSPWEFTTSNWRIKQVAIIAIKWEWGQIHS